MSDKTELKEKVDKLIECLDYAVAWLNSFIGDGSCSCESCRTAKQFKEKIEEVRK